MPSTRVAIEREFRAILASDSIRVAAPSDAVCGVLPQLVLEPTTERQLAEVLRVANDAGLAVTPRGGGTKMTWGSAPSRADLILSTARLNKIVEHVWADLTVTVEAGCTVQALQDALARHNQRLALDALWPERATIGGILSTNDSGALRLRFGSLRDLIIGVTVALPNGTLASSGGKVVKNVAGYDLPKLLTGALGTLGVITRAVFRLHPFPRYAKTLSIARGNLDAAQRLLLSVQDSQLAHTALQVRCAPNTDPIVDILFEGIEEGIAAQESQLRQLAGGATIVESEHSAWNACQQLWNSSDESVLAKFSILPAAISKTMEGIGAAAKMRRLPWSTVTQATGIGWLRMDGHPEEIHPCLALVQSSLTRDSGSLTLLHRPPGFPQFDPWGEPGDALPLMRAVKQQLDPKGTLNPGRFVGGI
jgi:glycolate oxidase FAD binding subunit